MSEAGFAIREASGGADVTVVKELFLEYAASLGFSLCFQGFDAELATLPGKYAPPDGRLMLAWVEDEVAGVAALRPLGPGICEMKRLFVRPAFRGRALGAALVECLVAEARAMDYRAMRLDTLPDRMGAAVALYKARGFVEIPAYYHNPLAGAVYLELVLH